MSGLDRAEMGIVGEVVIIHSAKSIHDKDMPLQSVEHITEDVGAAPVTEVAEVLAQEEGLMLKAGVGERLWQEKGRKKGLSVRIFKT
jgi:hypothetical protein